MTEEFFIADFIFEGMRYEGRISPERKHGHLASWHVVLNNTFFGYVSFDGKHWQVTEQRPAGLLEEVGNCIAAKGMV